MSEEADVFISSGQFIPANATLNFTFALNVDDAYWDLRIVTRGTNTNVEILRQFVLRTPPVRDDWSIPCETTRPTIRSSPVGPFEFQMPKEVAL